MVAMHCMHKVRMVVSGILAWTFYFGISEMGQVRYARDTR